MLPGRLAAREQPDPAPGSGRMPPDRRDRPECHARRIQDLGTGTALTFLVLLVLAGLGQATVAFSPLDEDLLYGLQAWRGPNLNAAMRLVTDLGSPQVLTSLVVLTGLMGWPSRAPADRFGPLGILLAASLVNTGLKEWFARPRPGPEFGPLVQEPLPSFPSGHTMLAFCVYGLLVWQVWRAPMPGFLKASLVALLTSLVVVIGISRVYLAAHYPSDVIAGFAAGIPLLWLATVLLRATGGLRKGSADRPG